MMLNGEVNHIGRGDLYRPAARAKLYKIKVLPIYRAAKTALEPFFVKYIFWTGAVYAQMADFVDG